MGRVTRGKWPEKHVVNGQSNTWYIYGDGATAGLERVLCCPSGSRLTANIDFSTEEPRLRRAAVLPMSGDGWVMGGDGCVRVGSHVVMSGSGWAVMGGSGLAVVW